MKRVLLTGIAGVGKSTLVAELAARGYTAVDADSDAFSAWAPFHGEADAFGTPVETGRDWVWREDRIRDLLSAADTDLLFLSGSAANMRQFLPQFDLIILLSAPSDVTAARLATRTTNRYGKRPEEVAREVELKQQVEPLLRRIAHHEIDTSATLPQVVATVLRLVDALPR